jgi:phage shock protein PspC (stress-responsive transcriptional regulator)/small basic protein
MNKVTTINLNGRAYQLEESGFDALHAYLEKAGKSLEGNPDKDEIMADLEQAIADKCERFLNPHKTVVASKEIEQIIQEMGPVHSGTSEAQEENAQEFKRDPNAPKRLYRITDGAVIGGVCTGIAAYFNIDVNLVRLIFIVATILTGGGVIVAYILMMILIPHANTSEEKAKAHGTAFTAQELVDRAKAEYANFTDKKEWRKRKREWKTKWKSDMQNNKKYWADTWGPLPHRGAGLLVPFISIVNAFLTIIWIFAIISLLTTGMIFSFTLPTGISVWIALIILACLFSLITWPLKAMRQTSYLQGMYGSRFTFRMIMVLDAFVWCASIVLFFWIANTYVPQAHALLDQFLTHATAFLDSFRNSAS